MMLSLQPCKSLRPSVQLYTVQLLTSALSPPALFRLLLLGICSGGTVGTALFISMGNGLVTGGPASLFIGYVWSAEVALLSPNAPLTLPVLPRWTSVICAVAECQLEMVSFRRDVERGFYLEVWTSAIPSRVVTPKLTPPLSSSTGHSMAHRYCVRYCYVLRTGRTG